MPTELYTSGRNRVVFLVDELDAEWCRQDKWYLHSGGYITRKIFKGRTVYLHREILMRLGHDITERWVDHVNGVKTDNRRENIRLCNASQNGANKSKYSPHTESVYKGVFRKNDQWYVQLKVDGKHISAGPFPNEEKAARRYDLYARKHFGEFARYNISRPTDDDMERFNDDLMKHAAKREITRLRNVERNRPKLVFKKTSPFRGVSFKRRNQKWVAQITYNHVKQHIGLYASQEEAARAYDIEAVRLYGSKAKLNFPL